jgi:hypothetical protein
MFAILHALGMFVVDLFKSRTRLEAENLYGWISGSSFATPLAKDQRGFRRARLLNRHRARTAIGEPNLLNYF